MFWVNDSILIKIWDVGEWICQDFDKPVNATDSSVLMRDLHVVRERRHQSARYNICVVTNCVQVRNRILINKTNYTQRNHRRRKLFRRILVPNFCFSKSRSCLSIKEMACLANHVCHQEAKKTGLPVPIVHTRV